MDKFDLKLIPKFGGSPMGPSVIEWFEKAEWVCRLFKTEEPLMVIPLRLMKGAYVIYQQLVNLQEIKCALCMAFGIDPFITWEKSVGQQLEPAEMVDIYQADLRRLVVPFGRATDRILECAFLVGIPDDVSWLL